MNRTLFRRAVAPLLLLPLAAVAPTHATEAVSDTLRGTVYLPGGTTPGPAAVVDLMLADPAGQPVPGTAFARGVADVDGRFAVNPRERDDLVAAARANGGDLPIAVQVGKLAAHGSLDPSALPAGRVPDTALAVLATTLTARTTTAADGGSVTTLVFEHAPSVAGAGTVNPGPALEVVLDLADTALRAANVLGMFSDPDLVAGNETLDDPDLIPPLGAIVADVVPVPDTPVTTGAEPAAGEVGVPTAILPHPENGGGGSAGSCGRDPGTQWVSKQAGNNVPGTKTYVYLDTYSCTKDNDKYRDEVIYKWGGYTVPADKHWTIYRLKYRTEIGDKYDYNMKYPDPVGDQSAGSSPTMNWTVGWDYFANATVSGSYHFPAKKIHGWQADGTGHLYHVSWIAASRDGLYTTDSINDGGGVNLDVPEGSDGRKGVANSVIVWRCYWPSGYDGSTPDPNGHWKPQCDG